MSLTATLTMPSTLRPGKASVDFDERLASWERVQSAVEDAGYGVAAGDDATSLRTKGAAAADLVNGVAQFAPVAGFGFWQHAA